MKRLTVLWLPTLSTGRTQFSVTMLGCHLKTGGSSIMKTWSLGKAHSYVLCCIQLSEPPSTVACQAPLSVEFSEQEYWSGLPFPSPRDLPDPVVDPGSPTLQADSLPSEPPGKTVWIKTNCGKFLKWWEYQTILPLLWEICMWVKKQQLEPDLEHGKGVQQSCILSPCLLNSYAEYIMPNTKLDESQPGIKIAGKINNLRYANDTTLMAEHCVCISRSVVFYSLWPHGR